MSTPVEPRFTRRGLGYQLDVSGAVLSLNRLRESRGELSGELTAAVQGRHLYRGRFNASSLRARSDAARFLTQHTNGAVPWLDVLEHLCLQVLNAERSSAPFVALGPRSSRQAAAHLVAPIMPDGAVTLLFGPGGVGKSTLAAAIALSVASGAEVVPGWLPQRQAPVAVLDYEADQAEWTDRIEDLAAPRGIVGPHAILYRPAQRPLADQVEEIAAATSQHGVGLLVVDSVGLASGTVREGGDAAETALRLFAALRLLAVPALLIDHVAGADLAADRTGTKPYGSVYKVNLARAVYELRREETPGAAVELLLVNRKVNSGSMLAPIGLRMTHGDGRIVIERAEVTAPELEQHSGSAAERMRRLLRAGAMAERDIAEELGVSAATVRSVLRRHPSFQRLSGGRIGLCA